MGATVFIWIGYVALCEFLLDKKRFSWQWFGPLSGFAIALAFLATPLESFIPADNDILQHRNARLELYVMMFFLFLMSFPGMILTGLTVDKIIPSHLKGFRLMVIRWMLRAFIGFTLILIYAVIMVTLRPLLFDR